MRTPRGGIWGAPLFFALRLALIEAALEVNSADVGTGFLYPAASGFVVEAAFLLFLFRTADITDLAAPLFTAGRR